MDPPQMPPTFSSKSPAQHPLALKTSNALSASESTSQFSVKSGLSNTSSSPRRSSNTRRPVQSPSKSRTHSGKSLEEERHKQEVELDNSLEWAYFRRKTGITGQFKTATEREKEEAHKTRNRLIEKIRMETTEKNAAKERENQREIENTKEQMNRFSPESAVVAGQEQGENIPSSRPTTPVAGQKRARSEDEADRRVNEEGLTAKRAKKDSNDEGSTCSKIQRPGENRTRTRARTRTSRRTMNLTDAEYEAERAKFQKILESGSEVSDDDSSFNPTLPNKDNVRAPNTAVAKALAEQGKVKTPAAKSEARYAALAAKREANVNANATAAPKRNYKPKKSLDKPPGGAAGKKRKNEEVEFNDGLPGDSPRQIKKTKVYDEIKEQPKGKPLQSTAAAQVPAPRQNPRSQNVSTAKTKGRKVLTEKKTNTAPAKNANAAGKAKEARPSRQNYVAKPPLALEAKKKTSPPSKASRMRELPRENTIENGETKKRKPDAEGDKASTNAKKQPRPQQTTTPPPPPPPQQTWLRRLNVESGSSK